MRRDREASALPRLHLAVVMPLLFEISLAVGNSAWSARELFRLAETDAQLRSAIVAAIGPLDAGATRRLGKLLTRCEGVALPDRYTVERMDDGSAERATWRVLRI